LKIPNKTHFPGLFKVLTKSVASENLFDRPKNLATFAGEKFLQKRRRQKKNQPLFFRTKRRRRQRKKNVIGRRKR